MIKKHNSKQESKKHKVLYHGQTKLKTSKKNQEIRKNKGETQNVCENTISYKSEKLTNITMWKVTEMEPE